MRRVLTRLFYIALFVLGIYVGLIGSAVPPYQVPARAANPRPGDPILVIRVYYVPQGKVLSMDLEEYVKGVVASEMPAGAGVEALKAQAVVARTNAVRKMRILGGTPSRVDADVSSDYKVDQAWNPTEALRDRWGAVSFWLNWNRIEKACEETRGMFLIYGSTPCEAVFHSTCGGRTEAARDVWGRDVPYLQSVACSFCQHSPYYKPQTVTIPLTQVSASLAQLGVSVAVSRITGSTIGVSQVSPTGRVKEVIVDGQRIRGLEFRMALNMRSTLMSWSVRGNNLTFQVRGYGHGAGMCQYGADGMARQGRTFQEILSYYYPGTRMAGIFDE